MLLKKIHSAPPVIIALLIQIVVFAVISGLAGPLENHLGYSLPFFWRMIGQGVVAAGITLAFGFSYWWVLIQFFAPPLLVLGLAFNIPVWIYPIILVFLAMTFWNVAINRVPLYLTNDLTASKLESLLPKKKDLKVVDLGSGLGGTMRHLAGQRPEQVFAGVESAPVPFLLSWILGKLSGRRNVKFIYANFWKLDLADFDVIYCFLSPVPMPELYAKAKEEMKPGSLFISNSFVVPDHKPDRTVTVKDGRKTRLMIWKL